MHPQLIQTVIDDRRRTAEKAAADHRLLMAARRSRSARDARRLRDGAASRHVDLGTIRRLVARLAGV